MSITDELRRVIEDPLLGYAPQDQHIELLTKIADRIDAEHQKAIRELNNLADTSVLLPVDADGEYIHIGDKVTLYGRCVYEVDAIFFYENGVSVSYEGESGCGCNSANNFHHYHAPTVEDVLRQFLGECEHASMLGYTDMPQDIFDTYTSKLRLAGDAE